MSLGDPPAPSTDAETRDRLEQHLRVAREALDRIHKWRGPYLFSSVHDMQEMARRALLETDQK